MIEKGSGFLSVYLVQYLNPYLSGTFITFQLCGFWHFSVVSATFASACKHVVTGGGGGMCILFEICMKTLFQKCMGLGGRA